jgi:hypothetical protein
MKNYNQILSVFFLIFSGILNAQVGIGNLDPNISSILDVTSTTQGILVPRMTSIERNNVASPAQGLLMYNTTDQGFNYIQSETIAPALPDWKDALYALKYNEQFESSENTMTLSTDVLVPSMSFSATAQSANYLVQFSAEYVIIPEDVLHEAKLSFDSSLITLNNLGTGAGPVGYQSLMPTNPTLTDGNNGVSVGPGVYSYLTAIVLAGELILSGNATDLFVFKISGALSSNSTAKITLSGGALASNVFWICAATVDLEDTTTMVGTLIAGAATSITDCTVQGRILVNGAALSIVNSSISIPLIGGVMSPLGRIEDFALYSSTGAISNAGLSTITGDIGTNLGLITNFVTGTVGNTAVVNGEVHLGTNIGTANFSVYKNGIQIPSSLRTRKSNVNTVEISLQTIARTVLKDQLVEVKCNVKSGDLKLTNKKLSFLKLR